MFREGRASTCGQISPLTVCTAAELIELPTDADTNFPRVNLESNYSALRTVIAVKIVEWNYPTRSLPILCSKYG